MTAVLVAGLHHFTSCWRGGGGTAKTWGRLARARNWRRALWGGLLVLGWTGTFAATIVVGPTDTNRSIQQAARIAKDGDTVEILPGEYRGAVAVWTQSSLTIRGMGTRPVFLADGQSAEGKAIWVVRGGAIRVENIAFRGARVADGNGAGIRLESGRLTVRECAFVDNETGILTANRAGIELTVENSEFTMAPRHPGRLHHLLYAGAIDKLSVTGSRFHNGYLGHLIKSRARESTIAYNLIHDNAGGSASYELDLPNGGLAFVTGNVIGQSATTENATVVAFGAEGNAWQDSALFLAHNTLISDGSGSATFLKVWSARLPDNTELRAVNNLFIGPGTISRHVAGRSDGNIHAPKSVLKDADAMAFELPIDSALRSAGRNPGRARGRSLAPQAEFSLPVGTRAILPLAQWAPGAFQRPSQ